MICYELLEIARPGEIESELLFHFMLILGVSSENTGHWRSLSNILENHNRNTKIDMNRDRPGCGGTRRDRRVIRAACDGTLTSRSWRSLLCTWTKRLKPLRSLIRVGGQRPDWSTWSPKEGEKGQWGSPNGSQKWNGMERQNHRQLLRSTKGTSRLSHSPHCKQSPGRTKSWYPAIRTYPVLMRNRAGKLGREVRFQLKWNDIFPLSWLR